LTHRNPSIELQSRRTFLRTATLAGAALGLSSSIARPTSASTHSYAAISTRARATLDQVDWDSFSGMKHIRGFNYQPSWGSDSQTVWLDKFDPERYRRELLEGKKYFPAFNCVRIWLGFRAYQQNPQLLLRNFNAAIDICAGLELLVTPVLFSVWPGEPPFDPVSVADLPHLNFDHAYGNYLHDLVTTHRGNNSILMWDLCNEPNEGNPLDPLIHAEASWLKYLHGRLKAIDPQARTCIGSIADFAWGQAFADYCDALTPHLYGYSIWKPHFDQGKTTVDFATSFECTVDQYLLRTKLLNPKPKPILSSETCWGAMDDMERKRIIQATLEPLKRHEIGFLAHALYASGVAGLHIPANYQAVFGGMLQNPETMQFINADGTLRPGHDVFNDY
jgi:hypothetical protein